MSHPDCLLYETLAYVCAGGSHLARSVALNVVQTGGSRRKPKGVQQWGTLRKRSNQFGGGTGHVYRDEKRPDDVSHVARITDETETLPGQFAVTEPDLACCQQMHT